jgi:hypothetical protein
MTEKRSSTSRNARRDLRNRRRIAQLGGRVRAGHGEQVAEVDGAVDRVHVVAIDAELLAQDREEAGVHRERHLDADGVASVAAAQLLLNGLEEVFCFFFVELEVPVSGDAKRGDGRDAQARKQLAHVAGDDVFEQDVRAVTALSSDFDEAGRSRGHLHDGVRGRAWVVLAFAEGHSEVEGLVLDARKRVSWVDREGREDGEDLALKVLA